MPQHPIPQNISSYQFRLIGDMTLKQFLQLLGGAGVAFIFYSTNLPGLIKWFFILISALLGIGFAFMPLEGRPLDRWLLAFIKAAYSPTEFIWKKSGSVPDYLTFKPKAEKGDPLKAHPPDVPQSPPPTVSLVTPTQPVDEKEKQRLSQVVNLFSNGAPVQPTTVADPIQPTPANSNLTQSSRIISRSGPPQKAVAKPDTSKEESPHSFQVTPLSPVKIETKTEKSPIPEQIFEQLKAQPTPQNIVSGSTTSTQPSTIQGTVNPNLPFPSLPTTPNVLVGMVLNSQGKIIENAVIEIKDSQGHPVRATKTNKLGQFFSVTPLKNGAYIIGIEKDSFSFDTITVNLTGVVHQPLEIRAKGVVN